MNKKLDVNECEDLVKSSKNVIFHGAPGTGKTYLAKQIAAKIVSNDCCDQYDKLENLQSQVGFIQFYPGYDYSNFVEGYKPSTDSDAIFIVGFFSSRFNPSIWNLLFCPVEGLVRYVQKG